MSSSRPTRSAVLFAVGVVLIVVAVVLVFLNRSPWAYGTMGGLGFSCMAFPLLHSDVDEASVEAAHGWVKLWWRKERVQEVTQDLAADTEPSIGADPADPKRPNPGFTVRPYATVEYADVNNDGEIELVVQYPHGAHSN